MIAVKVSACCESKERADLCEGVCTMRERKRERERERVEHKDIKKGSSMKILYER